MAITLNASDLEGRTVLSSDGEKLGKVDDVMVDDRGMPQYVRVRSGWFGLKHHVIPVGGLDRSGDDLVAMQSKAQLESAPTFGDDEDLDYDRERTVGAHYGTPVRDWDDTRDRWLAGEDLSRGPTPETRHPGGGADDVADTTQGPTPGIRQVMRTTDEDRAASGQPMADSRTRADIGGDQDRDDRLTRHDTRRDDDRRIRLRRWSADRPM